MTEIPMPESGVPPPITSSERPTGVVCITCLMILGGVFDLIISVYLTYYVLLGLANIIVGVFLYKLQPWAWMAAIVLNLIFLIINIISIIGIIGAIVNFIVLVYLNKSNVKEAFRQQASSSSEAW